ncbi:Inosine-5'-monophosphate dehydrogenase [Wickerhamomyces ciferrii]|uniref:Inosine-5'-monophosphate dehydrogenase n=1 Tax=Wickerhamomyces ciferrii (strain ATCC 14091 / BCRC 22168 / CBS 111 / JCM 3599 / NBRC 0793 / NRRL Y-1031 F-60-10) TaxID=1206466 RepID=K0KY31_WICCF|nr:Inosine-5'-monophosphate dehydrogenase [Wickerhamomyces ciferrii]CCH46008.1 Inosine-5'-monophosphate dehydrogenase [Wickerhamomyces ciferrii]
MSLRTPKKTQSTTSSGFSSTPTHNNHGDSILDSRKRQSKRDEAIRRRIENDLSKKRYGTKGSSGGAAGAGTSGKKRSRHSQPGSVLSLKPSEAVVCKPSFTAYEAAQLMSAKRENCILVIDDDERLLGIFTAKDLAFRVVSKGLKAGSVTIDQIMTENPLCATSNTPASEALNLMVERGFRHLPVLDENNFIYGVLDITKCYQEAMEKLERMYESSKKLHDALQGVQLEIGSQQQPLQVIRYFENLKSVMNGPTLESVLDENSLPSYVNVKTSVYDAAVLMKENHTTAVLVKDSNNEDVSGIFTSKDVVLRVIAAGLDPKTVSVIRVMTSQPDVAPKNLTIQQALRKMFDGHYLNLPIVEDDEIIGIVEVLKLTYATLNQISLMNSNESNGNGEEQEGPAWNKFWTSLDNDTESLHSDSQLDNGSQIIPDISQSEINQFSLNQINTNDNLGPNDSVSATNELTGNNNGGGGVNGSTITSNLNNKELIKEQFFAFKFKSPNGRNHRINLKPIEGIEELISQIKIKLTTQEFETLTQGYENFAISYIDDENDIVAITNDQDLLDCVLINKNSNLDKADLFIHNHGVDINLQDFQNQKKKIQKEEQQQIQSNEIIPGLSNEILIGTVGLILGGALLTVFTLNKK